MRWCGRRFTVKQGANFFIVILGTEWEEEEGVVSIVCVNETHTHLIKCSCNCMAAGQKRCMRLSVKRYMKSWWKVTRCKDDSESQACTGADSFVFVCMWVWQRREEDVTVTMCQSNTGQQVCFMKDNYVLLFFPLCSSLLILFIPPVCWWGCGQVINEGVGRLLPSIHLSLSLPVCLSTTLPDPSLLVYLVMRIWILVEDGCVVFTSHGLELILKCRLRESGWWEEGME